MRAGRIGRPGDCGRCPDKSASRPSLTVVGTVADSGIGDNRRVAQACVDLCTPPGLLGQSQRLGRCTGTSACECSPAGCGKTAFDGAQARLSGMNLRMLDAGGASGNRLLARTARDWTGTQPVLPLLAVQAEKVANPIISVDERDKERASRIGDPCASLIGLLEPETAKALPGSVPDRRLRSLADPLD
jgi:hypothetical protein